ncbi:hypothetical protein PV797_17415 [Clostridiaceae bacterium M8S5]|nr:hypothetical protein PV797_17415 [Clostridiaceae bacterium M8S5]
MEKETILLNSVLTKSIKREQLLKKKLVLYYKTTDKPEVRLLIKKLLQKSNQNIHLIDELSKKLIRI